MRTLINEERIELETLIKRTKDVSEWKRLFVILTYDEGLSIEEVAKLVRLSPFTVEQYLKEYSAKNKTKNDPRGGGRSKLSEEESKELESHLSKNTYLKVKNIVSYVEVTYGKLYSRTGITSWLKDRGFTFKRPEKVPGKLNLEQQAKFIEEYTRLRDSLGQNEELYFLDAVHPEYQSQAVSGWIKKGEKKTLQTTGKQHRLHFAGALLLNGPKVFIQEYKTIDGDTIVDFFRKLESHSKASRIHIVLDNAPAHKNWKVKEYLKLSKIELHYLPPYSPNLNPIERLWKVFREMTLYNRYFEDKWNFFAEVRSFFADKVHRIRHVLKQRINDDFQIMRLNPIKLS